MIRSYGVIALHRDFFFIQLLLTERGILMILNREEFFERLKKFTENLTDDDSLAFVEDVTDTYNDLERVVKENSDTWKKKYEDTQEYWKKRYYDRFFKGDMYSNPNERKSDTEEKEEGTDEVKEDITIDELFTEESEEE